MAIKREIKFKAWLPGIKKMTYGHTLEELMNWNTKKEDNGTAVWLEYTGRKDKKGIEIYEDDIVIDSEGRYAVVYWNLDDCQFLVDFQKDMEIEQISSNYIVCGNVWENIDLIK